MTHGSSCYMFRCYDKEGVQGCLCIKNKPIYFLLLGTIINVVKFSLELKQNTEILSTYSPFQYFNHISIEDSRVYELTNKAGLLSPYQILHECLKR